MKHRRGPYTHLPVERLRAGKEWLSGALELTGYFWRYWFRPPLLPVLLIVVVMVEFFLVIRSSSPLTVKTLLMVVAIGALLMPIGISQPFPSPLARSRRDLEEFFAACRYLPSQVLFAMTSSALLPLLGVAVGGLLIPFLWWGAGFFEPVPFDHRFYVSPRFHPAYPLSPVVALPPLSQLLTLLAGAAVVLLELAVVELALINFRLYARSRLSEGVLTLLLALAVFPLGALYALGVPAVRVSISQLMASPQSFLVLVPDLGLLVAILLLMALQGRFQHHRGKLMRGLVFGLGAYLGVIFIAFVLLSLAGWGDLAEGMLENRLITLPISFVIPALALLNPFSILEATLNGELLFLARLTPGAERADLPLPGWPMMVALSLLLLVGLWESARLGIGNLMRGREAWE